MEMLSIASTCKHSITNTANNHLTFYKPVVSSHMLFNKYLMPFRIIAEQTTDHPAFVTYANKVVRVTELLDKCERKEDLQGMEGVLREFLPFLMVERQFEDVPYGLDTALIMMTALMMGELNEAIPK